MTIIENLLNLLGAAFSGEATLHEILKADQDWNRLVWDLTPYSGDRLFRRPPAIEFRNCADDLRWSRDSIGMKRASFKISDLAAANPNDPTLRHLQIRQFATQILAQGAEVEPESNDLDAYHPAALVAALLCTYNLWIGSAAAISSEVTGETYWRCYKYGELHWRYCLSNVALALSPPYTPIQLRQATAAVSTPLIEQRVEEAVTVSGKKFISILANEEAGLHILCAHNAQSSA